MDEEDKKNEGVGQGGPASDKPSSPDGAKGGHEGSVDQKKGEGKENGDKDKGKKRKSDNVYDQYRAWGGDDDDDAGRVSFRGRNRFTLIVFIILIVSFAFLFFGEASGEKEREVSYSTFTSAVESGTVRSVDIQDKTTAHFTMNSGDKFYARIPYYDSALLSDLKAKNIDVSGSAADISWVAIVLQFVPWIIFIFLMFNLYRNTGGGGMAGGLGKNLAHQIDPKGVKTRFSDVAGQKESKYELQEVVDFLKHPERYKKIGARIPKGILLVGPPGTGKTLLARAVAGESGVGFLHTSGSDFVEMFVGMGAARVRSLFDQARKNSPCIIFIDEIDAVGRSRGSGLGGGHDEREQTLNQILVEMDGFKTDAGIIVMAATNRPDVLDPALLRPGRFDRQVVIDLPDVQERLDILRIHSRKVKLAPEVDLERIARATPGSSGADLANLVNEAALYAARGNRMQVSMSDFEEARDKVTMGVARKSRLLTDEEKLATAYHESGHTLVHYYLKHADPLHKVTIIPHGRALGVTMSLPEKDNYTLTRSYLMDRIVICMGGYVAEDIHYGETTTGTSNDMKQATEMAHRMVTEWGMSALGFISLGDEDEPLFLGREITKHKSYSDTTARKIDEEVRKILDEAMEKTRSILKEHEDQLDLLSLTLCQKETLDDSEIRDLLGFPPAEHNTKLI